MTVSFLFYWIDWRKIQ